MMMMPRSNAFLYALVLLLLLPVTATNAQTDNCGASWDASATEINGCNAKMEEDHACSFREDGSTSIAGASEEDRRTVDIQYHACQILSQHEDECSQPEIYVVHGNAMLLLDGMLVQRQPTVAGGQDDHVCFLYDHHDGKSPTEDCRMECLNITSTMGTETVINTNDVAGLPHYGSASRSRHVTIVATGIRSAATTAHRMASSWLVGMIALGVGVLCL